MARYGESKGNLPGGSANNVPPDATGGYGTYQDPMAGFYTRALQRVTPMVTAQNPGVTYKQDVPLGNRPNALGDLSPRELLDILLSQGQQNTPVMNAFSDAGGGVEGAQKVGIDKLQRLAASQQMASDIVNSLAKKNKMDVEVDLQNQLRDTMAQSLGMRVPEQYDWGGMSVNPSLERALLNSKRPLRPDFNRNPYVATPTTPGVVNEKEQRRRRVT